MKKYLVTLFSFVLLLLAACGQQTQSELSTSAAPFTVFDDSLASGWQDWSWETNYRYLDCACPQSGSKAIQANFKPWGGLSLRSDSAVSTTAYTGLSFGVYGVKGNTTIKVMVYSDDNTVTGSSSIHVSTGSWQTFNMPWSLLGNPSQIKRVALQNESGQNDSEILVDNLILTSSNNGGGGGGSTNVVDRLVFGSSGPQTYQPYGLPQNQYTTDWLREAHAVPLADNTVWPSGWFIFYPRKDSSFTGGDIQLRLFTVYAHKRSGGWTRMTDSVDMSYFRFDFGGSAGVGDGSLGPAQFSGNNNSEVTVVARSDTNVHGYGYGCSVGCEWGSQYDGYIVAMDAKTDLQNWLVVFGMDGKNRDGSLTQLGGEGAGKFELLTSQWQFFGLSDMSRERLQADPPPIGVGYRN